MEFLWYTNQYLYSSEIIKKRATSFKLLSFLFCSFFLNFLQKIGSEDEVIQLLVGGIKYLFLPTPYALDK